MTDVFAELATKLRGVAREHAVAEASRRQLERWRVLSLNPLTAGHPDGDIIASENDEDFHVASRLDDYDEQHGIKVGDVLLVEEHDGEWTALDVARA